MRLFKTTSWLFAVAAIMIFISCAGGQKKANQAETVSEQPAAQPVEINNEAKLLLKYFESNGDYVNSRDFPSLIKAASVFEELNGNIHIIDLRGPKSFAEGHIKGAVKVDFKDLPEYFAGKIKPFEFDKIIVVCFSGQISSYATSLLRLMGYGNVYAMRWGMSGWNKNLAYQWLEGISSEYEGKLELTENEKAAPGDFPVIGSGKENGDEIADVQFKRFFEAGWENALISAQKVFDQPDKYYIINFERKDKYDAGHIPGAIRYKTNGMLGIISEMQTIPVDKEIVVYCGTGHNSGFATAYLRLFGYNAKTLTYGNNAFMHNKMVAEKDKLSWQPFTEAEIGDYPIVK
jgi:rhodanese-related sulfurtransferase